MSDRRTYSDDEIVSMVLSTLNLSPTNAITEIHLPIASFTTTTNTPFLITSIPIGLNKTYYISTYLMAVKSDGLTRNVGTTDGVFHREGGNLSQEGTLTNTLTGILSTSKITYTLNNTTHAVEVYANGLAATTINWYVYVDSKFNT